MKEFLKNIFKREFFKRDVTLALTLAFSFSIIMALVGFDLRCQDLRENVLRLHILANSDVEKDQAVKLKVRDRLLAETKELYLAADSKEDAIKITNKNLHRLTAAAEDELRKNGYSYGVRISVGETFFETREYEDFTLPAGSYQAVRVLLGEGKGKNWWCVMFPSLCIPAAGERHSLKEAVQNSSAEIAEKPTEYKVGFKAIEIYEGIKNFFKDIF